MAHRFIGVHEIFHIFRQNWLKLIAEGNIVGSKGRIFIGVWRNYRHIMSTLCELANYHTIPIVGKKYKQFSKSIWNQSISRITGDYQIWWLGDAGAAIYKMFAQWHDEMDKNTMRTLHNFSDILHKCLGYKAEVQEILIS